MTITVWQYKDRERVKLFSFDDEVTLQIAQEDGLGLIIHGDEIEDNRGFSATATLPDQTGRNSEGLIGPGPAIILEAREGGSFHLSHYNSVDGEHILTEQYQPKSELAIT